MNKNELNEILDKHKKWLDGDKDGIRADLSKANLYNANLYNADLRNANLYNANLYNANLYNANLYNADLSNANLNYANLSNANLNYANLSNADLSNANLYNANLNDAKGVLSFIGEKDLLVYFKHNGTYYFKIGCKTLEAKEWIKRYKEIGKNNGYTSNEIELYGSVIKLFSKYDLENA